MPAHLSSRTRFDPLVRSRHKSMSIANELSCDVAAAVFAKQETQAQTDKEQLTELVLTLHTTLRQMTNEARDRRRAQLSAHKVSAHNAQTAGN